MSDKKTTPGIVSIVPSSMTKVDTLSLRSVLEAGIVPPVIPDHNRKDLYINAYNATSLVAESLRRSYLFHMGYTDLSRLVLHSAVARMIADPMMVSIIELQRLKLDVLATLPKRTRDYYDGIVSAAVSSYSPVYAAKYVHGWYFSAEDRKSADECVAQSGIAERYLFMFAAIVLSEMTELQQIASDLSEEGMHGMRSLRYLQFTLRWAIEDVGKTTLCKTS